MIINKKMVYVTIILSEDETEDVAQCLHENNFVDLAEQFWDELAVARCVPVECLPVR